MSRGFKTLVILCLFAGIASGQITRNMVRLDAFNAAWNGDLYRAPSADAVYDVLLGIVPVGTDPNLIAIAALNATANQFFYWTGPGTVALTDLSAYMRGLLDDPNQAVLHASLNLEIGVDVQAYDPNLTYWANYDPNDFQPADPNLTYWANYDPNDYVPSTDFPDSNDPDVTAPGQVGRDHNDNGLRGHDGTNQFSYGERDRTIQFTRTHPKDDCNDLLPVWENGKPFTFKIEAIHAWADVNETDFTLKECDPNGANVTTIEAVNIDTTGTGFWYELVSAGIDHTTIEAGHLIFLDANATDDPNWVKVSVIGYYDADKD
jgi:hypothetical protein